MSAPSIVRLGRPEDHTEIWRLLLQAHNENGMFPLAPEKVQWILNRTLFPEMIDNDDVGPRGVIGVIGGMGSLEGLIILTIGTYWYSNVPHLEEWIVYTDPEHRNTNHAQALIQWMKDQVEATKLSLVTGIISNHRTEAKCRLYRRLLPKVGEFFLLTPKGSMATVTSS